MSSNAQLTQTQHIQIIKPDGDKASLPLEICRTPLWSLSSSNSKKLEAGQNYCREFRNAFGDNIVLRSDDILRPNPDMGVLLALIALFQKRIFGRREYDITALENEQRTYYEFSCTITELMRSTGIKHEKRLMTSLKRLGSIQLKFRRAPSRDRDVLFAIYGMFRFDIKRVEDGGCRTHKNDRLICNIHKVFIPQQGYLYKSVQQCLRLTKDTSKLIFWALCSRSHLKATAKEWYEVLYPDTKTSSEEITEQSRQKLLWDWTHRSFMPALAELKEIGFTVRVDKGANTTYYVSVPARRASLHCSNSDRTQENSDRAHERNDAAPEFSDRTSY